MVVRCHEHTGCAPLVLGGHKRDGGGTTFLSGSFGSISNESLGREAVNGARTGVKISDGERKGHFFVANVAGVCYKMVSSP